VARSRGNRVILQRLGGAELRCGHHHRNRNRSQRRRGAGAAVAVHNTNTGATLSLVTNGAGLYVAPFMQPGSYEITANKAGFGKILRQNLVLQVGQTLTVDVPLPLASTTETVT